MTILSEQPMIILFGGVFAVVLTLVALIRTGRVVFLYRAVGFALVTALLLVVERNIITTREELNSVLHEISAELTADNIPAVLNYFSPEAASIRDQAERLFEQVRVDRVSIKNNLEVTPKEGRDDLVVATFNAVGVASERKGKGGIRDQTVPQFFTVEFVQEAGQWRILSYKRQPPHQGIRGNR